jgi:hypothetical protein
MPEHPPGQPPKARRFHFGYVLLTVGLLAVLGYVIWALQASWALAGGPHMSVNGWIALGLAFVLTGALGGGLMWLAFYSSRKGFDDNVGGGED